MIQRFSVHFENPDLLDAVMEGLESIGFNNSAIRVWYEENSKWVNVHAYRDGDLDKMPRLNPNRMEDYCVKIWSRIGYARIVLTEHDSSTPPIEYAQDKFFIWEAE